MRYFVITERVTDYRAPFGIIRFRELGLAELEAWAWPPKAPKIVAYLHRSVTDP